MPETVREWYFTNASITTGVAISTAPTYPTQAVPNTNIKL